MPGHFCPGGHALNLPAGQSVHVPGLLWVHPVSCLPAGQFRLQSLQPF